MDDTERVTLNVTLRRKKIQGIGAESELHALMQDLLPRIGYDWAEVTHGPNEHGKDLVAWAKARTGGDEYLAVVAKIGSISASASGSQNLLTIVQQVQTCFAVPYEGHRVRTGAFITRVLVVCTGNISDQAQTQIRAQAGELRAVDFWPLGTLEPHITKHLPGFYYNIAPQIHDYLVLLRDKCLDVTEEHRRLGSQISRLLPQVFVEPRLLPLEELSQPASGRMGRKLGRTGLVYSEPAVATFDTTYLEYPSQSLVIMGEPGSGKTFAMRKAAQRLVERRLAGDDDAPLPLFIPATSLGEDPSSDPETDLTRCMVASDALDAMSLRNELTKRQSVLFVDALDQVATNDNRDAVLGKLQALEDRYPRLRIVCTMRIMRFWKPDELRSFRQALVLPMNNRSVAKLLENLLGRGKKYVDVLRALSESGLNKSLPKTPLVVTIIAILHEQLEMDEVPATVGDLYDMFLQVYLGRWSTHLAGTQAGPPAYQLRLSVLREVAYFLHDTQQVVAPLNQVAPIVDRYLLERGLPNQGLDLLKDIAEHSGILILLTPEGFGADTPSKSEVSSDLLSVTFYHHSFQEYLVASRYAQPGRDSEELVSRFLDPWWSNVVTFFVSIVKDAPTVLDKLVETQIPDNPLRCLHVSLQLGHVLQAAIQTPTDARSRGCLHGSDLIQAFYSAYSDLVAHGNAPANLSRLHLLFILGVLYSVAYGSAYLAPAQRQAFETLLDRFLSATGDERMLYGLRAFCSAAAIADRGDLTAMGDFIEAAKLHDFPVLQAAAAILEALEPVVVSAAPADVQSKQRGLRAQWEGMVRRLRSVTPRRERDSLVALGSQRPRSLERHVSLMDREFEFKPSHQGGKGKEHK